MNMTFKFFIVCLCCSALTLLSGCGGGVPKLTPVEQAEANILVAFHFPFSICFHRGENFLLEECATLPYTSSDNERRYYTPSQNPKTSHNNDCTKPFS